MSIKLNRFTKLMALFMFAMASIAFGQRLDLDNGVIKVGCDIGAYGGAITYLSESGTSYNLVNNYDRGRQIQQSVYSGQMVDRTSEGQHPDWSPWTWNPIQVGDSYGNSSPVIDYSNDGTTVYTKTIPLLWDMNNEQAEAIMEQWTTLEGSAVHVKTKLTCTRTDNTWGVAMRLQEMPAVYTIADLNQQYLYLGNEPWSNGPLTYMNVYNCPPWVTFGHNAVRPGLMEGWAASVNSSGWGVGVYLKNAEMISGGMHGSKGTTGGEFNSATTYLSPNRFYRLEKDSALEYEYWLIVGNLGDIRTFVYNNKPDNLNPHYFDFEKNGEWNGWYVIGGLTNENANQGTLSGTLINNDPILSKDYVHIIADQNRWAHIRMKNNTDGTSAQFWWVNEFGVYDAVNRNLPFTISANDTTYKTYHIDMSQDPDWEGTVKLIRFDPSNPTVGSGSIDVDYIIFDDHAPYVLETDFESDEGWASQASWPLLDWTQTLNNGEVWGGQVGAGSETPWVRSVIDAGYDLSDQYIALRLAGAILETPSVDSPGTLFLKANRSADTADWTIVVEKSYNSGAWENVDTFTAADVASAPAYTHLEVAINDARPDVRIRLRVTARTAGNCSLDNLVVSEYVPGEILYTSFESWEGWSYDATFPTSDWLQTLNNGDQWQGLISGATETFWRYSSLGTGSVGDGQAVVRTPFCYLLSPVVSEAGELRFDVNRSASDADWVMAVIKSINQNPWQTIGTVSSADVVDAPSYTTVAMNVGEENDGDTIQLAWVLTSRTAGNARIDEIQLDGYIAPNWTPLTYDDFESGWGNWTDGGGDCSWYTGGTHAHQGSAAANIQDNSGNSSSFYTSNGIDVDAPGYVELKVEFWFKAVSMENGEDFWVQYWDGSMWHTVAAYARGTDFNNDTFYSVELIIPESSYTFPSDMKLRFMCDASGNTDDIYIDEIKVSAK